MIDEKAYDKLINIIEELEDLRFDSYNISNAIDLLEEVTSEYEEES